MGMGDEMVQHKYSGNGHPNILLVDDCEHHKHIMAFLLDGLEANISTASDGCEAVEMIASGDHFDLILMDDEMPGMDGLEATAAIRKMDQKTPVVFCSSRSILKTKQQAKDVGGNDVVEKPIFGNAFNQAIQAYI